MGSANIATIRTLIVTPAQSITVGTAAALTLLAVLWPVSVSPDGAPAAPTREKADATPRPLPSRIAGAPSSSKARSIAEFPDIAAIRDSVQRNRAMADYFAAWAASAPASAAEFARSLPDDDIRKEALLHVMQIWAAQDGAAALAWAASVQFASPYEREVAMSMACTEVSRSDPSTAISLAIEHHLHQSENGLLQSLTTQWAREDLSTAREWVLSQPAGETRDTLVASLSSALFDDDLTAATELIVESIPPGESQNKAILDIISRLALRDVESAQEWIDTFPPGTLRERAKSSLDHIRLGQHAGH